MYSVLITRSIHVYETCFKLLLIVFQENKDNVQNALLTQDDFKSEEKVDSKSNLTEINKGNFIHLFPTHF